MKSRHMRAVVAALTVIPAVAQADMRCSRAPGLPIHAKLIGEDGAPPKQLAQDVVLVVVSGGVAEYTAHGVCTLLTFTAIRDGGAVYTDDGLGRGLTVVVGKDNKLTVVHAAGWIGKSE